MGLRPPTLVLVAILASVAARGEAVRCYTCTSASHAACGDPFDGDANYAAAAHWRVECSPDALEAFARDAGRALAGAAASAASLANKLGLSVDVDVPRSAAQVDFVCQKIKYSDGQGQQLVLRSCAIRPDAASDTCPPQDVAGVKTLCKQCSEDLCNAAPAAPAIAPLALALALALLALRPCH